MGHSCPLMPRFPQFLPGFLFCNTMLAFFIAYVWSVELSYVYDFFPYISDAGGKQPVSCVFGQMLNISAVIAMMIIYLRFKLVLNVDNGQTAVRIWNKCSLVLGVISVLGLSMVANFQVETKLIQVHLVGAGMVFVGGTLYETATCVITYFLRKQGFESSVSYYCRVIFTVATAIFLVSTFIAAGAAQYQWSHSIQKINNTRFAWHPDDPGFNAHIISTFSEWLMGLVFLIFFLTFHGEFSRISAHVKLLLRGNNPFGVADSNSHGGPMYA